MKIVQVELPEQVATELELLIRDGWFTNEAEAIRLALFEFLRHNQIELLEQFQREDIRWAMQQKPARA